ncbi:uncharacterized protein CcaverHIS019_0212380 [Cutaneotrichosporon cavernicola]|uniref:Amino acid transporter n=1 Tax=Cutaneotrichosporon cavernicola TaxID=279322 RepID=A0AA48I2E7_9TREE|nr:uncharacterized protein CcaverHIS019_0212380 [Cutaneotrichosporon cavernicola]BEI89876.1 hypothetical protein CcaverHIS019_0212380 [Cutaneotrichosporon cavernicola]BEI97647.1 hypothetical protein CcaverHIS631_0212360 [Cutaneotrichosporon cavernicola]BEJ05424.1 hypothetical protein CcaverHIS641_0212410 [Cutaneotrichosporon cavernicola]
MPAPQDHAARAAALDSERSGLTAPSSGSDSSSSSDDRNLNYGLAAPTPYNTYIEPTTSQTDSVYVGAPTASYLSTNDAYNDAYLTPTYSVRSDYDVPYSSRPVPAPPQIRTSDSETELAPVMSPDTTRTTRSSLTPDPGRIKGLGFLSRRSSKTVLDRDTLRLQQLGYDAVLGRNYTFWSSLALAWLNINSLQGTIFAVPGAYKYVSGILSMCMVATMSELASAYPVAGAMSSWAWKLTRNGIGGERYWGWIVSAFVMGGHIGNLVLVSWQNTSLIVGTMNLAFGFQAESWHRFMFMLAIVTVVGCVGMTHWGSGPRYWKSAAGFTLGAWLCLCIALVAKGVTHRTYSKTEPAISTHFYNDTGFSSRGLVWLLGWQNCTIATGSDVSAHMSEETQNPSRNVPNAMIMSIVVTYTLGYISIILLFISVKPGDAAAIAVADFPVGHILLAAVNEDYAIAICSIMAVVLCIQLQAQLQASSRFAFALARDNAMPFSHFVKRTNKYKQPWVATLLCIGLWAPWCLLFFANRGHVTPVITACASSLSMLGYVIPIVLYLFSKKDLQQEGRTSWSLRRFSRPIAVIAALYCSAVVTMQIFPTRSPVTVNSISWTPVVVAGTLLISLITWKLYGSRHYSGPIRALTKWEAGVELDLDSTLQMSTQRPSRTVLVPTEYNKPPNLEADVRSANTVSVNSARTASIASGGEWAAAPFSTVDSEVAHDLGLSFSSGSATSHPSGVTGVTRSSGPVVSFAINTMGRVAEADDEGDGVGGRSRGRSV